MHSPLAGAKTAQFSSPQMPCGQIPLGAYIFHRIHQLGVRHVLGCPGDFNLNLLDHLYTVADLQWVGTCNELNAAYAADGYARVRGIPGVLITTYGVGELSAINGVAGAYSEHVPVIHIVGTTSRLARKSRIMIHHTLDEDWDHDIFQKMSEPVRSASAFLLRDSTFTTDVDMLLETCVKTRRPVYLYVPMDTPDILVDARRLQEPLDLEIRNEGEEARENEIVEHILTNLRVSKRPAILVDVLAQRYGALEYVRGILESTGIPAFVTPLSKSHIDETSPSFAGLYNGELTPDPTVRQKLEESDLILHIGPLPSDSNTGGWSQNLPVESLISLDHHKIVTRNTSWKCMHFVPILRKLASRLQYTRLGFSALDSARRIISPCPQATLSGPLQQRDFWRQFSPFLRPGDCVIAEVGSAQYGTLELALPHRSTFFTQLYYSCIGFTVGALLGALIARREQGASGRTILFIGDGSLHMTVQELSTIIRNGFNPIIVLVNNSGYTIERVIHGPNQHYNEISTTWDYQNMLRFFGSRDSCSYSARTYEELDVVLKTSNFIDCKTPQLLEVFMDKFDAPWMLTAQVNIVQSKYGKQLDEWDSAVGRQRQALDTNLYQSKFALPGQDPGTVVASIDAGIETDEVYVNGYSTYGDVIAQKKTLRPKALIRPK